LRSSAVPAAFFPAFLSLSICSWRILKFEI
jgi:hypothetical protein